MNQRLSDEDLAKLRRYASRCCDLMNYANIPPGILIELLDGYKKEDE
ncbi:hypothetical protein D070_13380 [Bacillus velezensis]|nr:MULTISPECIES: hypothetical protein [Bacillus subtilis group]MDK1004044.1 hypothetical protein [Bacillus subtilis]NTU28378.1 hypothetical protein [Bacillus tequilensis]